MSTATTKRAKPKTAKPRDLAFVNETPCPNCGCEWYGPTVKFLADGNIEHGTSCANPWCDPISQFRALVAKLKTDRVVLAMLSCEQPQFDTPFALDDARQLRDRVLAAVKVDA